MGQQVNGAALMEGQEVLQAIQASTAAVQHALEELQEGRPQPDRSPDASRQGHDSSLQPSGPSTEAQARSFVADMHPDAAKAAESKA